MAKRLFVGGLSYNTTDAQLKDLFAQYGAVVSCTAITDRMTGQSKGFAFVELENDKEADEAMAKLNGYELDGRKIAVNKARPRPERTDQPYQSRGDGGDRRDSFRSPRRGGGNRGGRY